MDSVFALNKLNSWVNSTVPQLDLISKYRSEPPTCRPAAAPIRIRHRACGENILQLWNKVVCAGNYLDLGRGKKRKEIQT